MNERIKKLRKQAINFCLDKGSQGNLSEEVSEKFAELIVQECAEVCHKMAEDSDSYVVHDGDTCAEQIKQHFGVK